MGREIRRVPPTWQHPQDAQGRYIPLFDGADYARLVHEWDAHAAQWRLGFVQNLDGAWVAKESYGVTTESFEDWCGPRPDLADYMPQWTPEEATHVMAYECTSEGAPLSPAFATVEEAARWCADQGVSAWGGETADYAWWLDVFHGAFSGRILEVPSRP